MKNAIHISLICLVLVFISCKKDIPSDKLGFIGTWECASCVDEAKTLIIKADGTGSFHSLAPGKEFSIAGRVKFDGSSFRIGGALIKKKFKTDKYPLKEIVSLKPYTYKWTAEFNYDEYLKTAE